MTASEERQFHRGKDARRCGEPRQLMDGRASTSSRAAFNRGWDEQDKAVAAATRTPEQTRAANELLSKWKTEVREALA